MFGGFDAHESNPKGVLCKRVCMQVIGIDLHRFDMILGPWKKTQKNVFRNDSPIKRFTSSSLSKFTPPSQHCREPGKIHDMSWSDSQSIRLSMRFLSFSYKTGLQQLCDYVFLLFQAVKSRSIKHQGHSSNFEFC